MEEVKVSSAKSSEVSSSSPQLALSPLYSEYEKILENRNTENVPTKGRAQNSFSAYSTNYELGLLNKLLWHGTYVISNKSIGHMTYAKAR